MEDNKKFFKGFLGGILTATLLISIVLFINKYSYLNIKTANLISNSTQETTTSGIGSKAVETKINVIKQIIDKYYLDQAKEEDLVDGMYKGLVDGLGDPYSVYYTEADFKSLMESTNGV